MWGKIGRESSVHFLFVGETSLSYKKHVQEELKEFSEDGLTFTGEKFRVGPFTEM